MYVLGAELILGGICFTADVLTMYSSDGGLDTNGSDAIPLTKFSGYEIAFSIFLAISSTTDFICLHKQILKPVHMTINKPGVFSL